MNQKEKIELIEKLIAEETYAFHQKIDSIIEPLENKIYFQSNIETDLVRVKHKLNLTLYFFYSKKDNASNNIEEHSREIHRLNFSCNISKFENTSHPPLLKIIGLNDWALTFSSHVYSNLDIIDLLNPNNVHCLDFSDYEHTTDLLLNIVKDVSHKNNKEEIQNWTTFPIEIKPSIGRNDPTHHNVIIHKGALDMLSKTMLQLWNKQHKHNLSEKKFLEYKIIKSNLDENLTQNTENKSKIKI